MESSELSLVRLGLALAPSRRLVCFDLETTGLVPERDRIVEIALAWVTPVAIESGTSVDGTAYQPKQFETLVNPGIPIPAEAGAVHGITNEQLAGAPTFTQVASVIWEIVADADFIGFNLAKFDLPMLRAELGRVGRQLDLPDRPVIDVYQLFRLREPHDLATAMRFYCNREIEGAHRAGADVAATVDVLLAQLDRYRDLPRWVPGLHGVCNPKDPNAVDADGKLAWSGQEIILTFGKYKGETLRSLCSDPDRRNFLRWVLGKDFAEDTKTIIRNALRGAFPARS